MIGLMSDAVGLAANGKVIFLRVIKPINHFAPLYLCFDPLLGVSKPGVCSPSSKRSIRGFRKLEEKKVGVCFWSCSGNFFPGSLCCNGP